MEDNDKDKDNDNNKDDNNDKGISAVQIALKVQMIHSCSTLST